MHQVHGKLFGREGARKTGTEREEGERERGRNGGRGEGERGEEMERGGISASENNTDHAH